MKKPTYLSPTSLSIFEQDRDKFYLQYLTDVRPPRDPQTLAQSVGSAFDSVIKSYLYTALYGNNGDGKYEKMNLFESQVEKHNRDIVLPIGEYLFLQYRASGALSDLMLELQTAVDEPQFEFTVQGQIKGYRESRTTHVPLNESDQIEIPLLGKPDIKFINNEGQHCLFDWKVNGYYGSGNTSPLAGYIECREQMEPNRWLYRGKHKNAVIGTWKGIKVNLCGGMEDYNKDWASQLSTYGWLMGEEVGVESVVGVDQIVCNCTKRFDGAWPVLRIASHRTKVRSGFQLELVKRYSRCWSTVISDPFWLYPEMTLEDSQAKCRLLDDKARFLSSDLSDEEKAILEMSKPTGWKK